MSLPLKRLVKPDVKVARRVIDKECQDLKAVLHELSTAFISGLILAVQLQINR